MAQYSTDFSEYPTGSAPSDWTLRSGGTTLDIVADAGSVGGRVLRVEHTDARWCGASWDDVSSTTVVEVAVLAKASVVTSWIGGFGCFARYTDPGGGVSAFESYQATHTQFASPSVYLQAGSGTGIGDTAAGYAVNGNNKVWARIRCDGTTISAWFWEDGQTEKTNADTPDITGTNATYTTGLVGVFSDVGGTGTLSTDFEFFGVGTDGDAAPTSTGPGDTQEPTLSSPTGTSTGETTADGSVSTDEANGTLYWVATTSATAPSVAQIQAGQDNTGSAAAASGNQAVSATGVQNVSATGLTNTTSYHFHYQHQDAAANDSTVSTSAQFTTDAPSVTSITVTGITGGANQTGLLWFIFDDATGAMIENGSGASIDGNEDMTITMTPGPANGLDVWYVVMNVAGTMAATGPAVVSVT